MGGDRTEKAEPFPEWIEEIRDAVCSKIGIQRPYPNSCTVKLYNRGYQCMPYHQDENQLFLGIETDACMVSFTLGFPRPFKIRLHDAKESKQEIKFYLGPGDILTMEGKFQKYYEHALAADTTNHDERINFTFRYIQLHNDDDGCNRDTPNLTQFTGEDSDESDGSFVDLDENGNPKDRLLLPKSAYKKADESDDPEAEERKKGGDDT